MIVLDTHVMVWWAAGNKEKLSPAASSAIELELTGGQIMISTISSWELAVLVNKGRIALTMDVEGWLNVLREIEAVAFVPVSNEIGVKSVELPGNFHKDPADRMIVATARMLSAQLVTSDEKIRAYPHVRTIW